MKTLTLILSMLLLSSCLDSHSIQGRSPAQESYSLRQEILDCRGDSTCLSLVLLKAIERKPRVHQRPVKVKFFSSRYTTKCDMAYYIGTPKSTSCPELIQTYNKYKEVIEVSIDGVCHEVRLPMERACQRYGKVFRD